MPRPRTSILNDEAKVRYAAENNSSIKDAILSLGLRAAGGNYKAFKQACLKYNIQIPQFDYSLAIKKTHAANTTPLEKILIENSAYTSRQTLKKRCYAAGLLQEQCYSCGIGPEWNGRPLTLQLEHKNGIYNDNRIDNLAILCPNCHTQTSTYAGRSLTKSNAKRIRNYAPLPKDQWKPRPTKIDWPPKEKLQNLIKEHGYCGAGRILGVTDNAIRKHLRNR